MMNKYGWAEGSRLGKFNAQIIGEYLDDRGFSRPEELVADARRKQSPLHRLFEWDDDAAAEQYRLSQARHVLGSIRIVYAKAEGKEHKVRAFTFLPSQKGYVSRARILSDDDLRREAYQVALRDLNAFIKRFEEYADLVAIGRQALKRVQALIKKKAA